MVVTFRKLKESLKQLLTYLRYQLVIVQNEWDIDAIIYLINGDVSPLKLLQRAETILSYRHPKTSAVKKLVVGDIIKDDNPIPRGRWRQGQVVELVIPEDENIHGAKLVILSKLGK